MNGPPPGGPRMGHPPGADSASASVPWTDVQVHLRAGPGRDFDSAIQTALGSTAPLGRKALVLVPQPFPGDGANANVHDYEVFMPAVRRRPSELAFLGGSRLNAMLQATAPQAVTAEARRSFLAQAGRILDDGARGFGELALLHFSEFAGHPYERAEPDHPLMLALADLAASRDALIAVHMEAAPHDMSLPSGLASPPNPLQVRDNVAAFKRLLSHNPATRFVWLHAGWDNTGERTPELSRRLLTEHSNLYLSIKFHRARYPQNQLASESGPNPAWMDVVRTFPDRFMIGSDSFFAVGNGPAGTIFESQPIVGLLNHLPPPLAHRIGALNAQNVYRLNQ